MSYNRLFINKNIIIIIIIIMDIKNIIKEHVRNYILTENQNDKLVYVSKQGVDNIRLKNKDIDKVLKSNLLDNKNIYIKGGAARLALQIYGGFEPDNVIRDVDFAFIGEGKDYKKIFAPIHEYNKKKFGEWLGIDEKYWDIESLSNNDAETEQARQYFIRNKRYALLEVLESIIETYGTVHRAFLEFKETNYFKEVPEISYEGNSIENYFKTRDFTINEVLLNRDNLIFTRRAYSDFNKKRLNPKTRQLSGRMASRLFLFAARYDYNIIDSIQIEEENYFQTLIALLKAYELGIEDKFFEIYKKYFTSEMKQDTVEDLLIVGLDNSPVHFKLRGREKDIAKVFLSKNGYRIEKLYKNFPELKSEVDKLKINDYDIDYYKPFLKKKNRNI